MKTKTKKLTCLSLGLTGALATSAVIGAALSACTVTTSGSTSNDNITLPDTWYSKDINWDDATSRNNLIMDKQGIVYSNKYMTEIIAIAPGYGGSTITIPASVKTIGGYNKVTTSGTSTTKTATGAFEGLKSLTNVVFAGKNVTQIGGSAFKSCTSLQTINLPSSVNLIGSSAFENCSSLSSINLENIQYIGASAFSGAFTNIPFGSLDISLPKVSYIGASAFLNATGVKYFDFSKNTTLTTIGASAFSGCTYLTGIIDLTNDNYLSSIGASAFSGCTGITNIYLSSVTPLKTIGASAFSGCTSLVSIGTSGVTSGFIIPSTVTSIGTTAFANTLISSIDMSQTTATNPLNNETFKDMPELASINLGTHITTLPRQLFQNTPKLAEFDLVLPSSVTTLYSGDGNSVGVSSYNPTSYSTFYKSGFRSIDLSKTSSTSTFVGYACFEGCSNLVTVKLKSTVTQIRFRGFYDCTSLKNVIFSSSDDSSTEVETSGFVAHSSLTTIGSYAFYNSGLEVVDLSAVTANIMGDNNINTTSNTNNTYRFANCSELTTVKLPPTTTLIPEYNFYNVPKLNSVNFNELSNLASIYRYNFIGTSFTEIDLSNTKLTNINNLNNTTQTVYNFSSLTQEANIKLPPTLTDFNSASFTWLAPNSSGDGTIETLLPISYPNGYGASTTSYTNSILSATSTNFSLLSRVSGLLDFSNFTSLNGIGQNTAFNGTSISSLKFSASTFASGTIGTTTDNGYLGFVGTGITEENNITSQNPTTYATGYLPFGNMSSLNTITFNNFINSSNTSSSSVLAKTTKETWNEVARIISSFDKSTNDSSSESSSIVPNLSTWTKNPISVSVTPDDGNNDIVSVELKDDSNVLTTISDDMTENNKTFKYGNVTWTINMDSANGTITLTSSADVDTYRLIVAKTNNASGYNFFKTFFNTQSTTGENGTTITPNSSITVTLNIVTASSSSE